MEVHNVAPQDKRHRELTCSTIQQASPHVMILRLEDLDLAELAHHRLDPAEEFLSTPETMVREREAKREPVTLREFLPQQTAPDFLAIPLDDCCPSMVQRKP